MALKAVTIVILLSLTLAECSLLEMSRDLWTKLVTGGLAQIGQLDPLKVPMIKVDQSEGDTNYRMILKNVEIIGLNNSTLESIHIARGRLKSNLSELEAGYVSYSDLRDLDSIRYRFHTLVKEPRGQNESFEAIVSSKSLESHLEKDSPASRFMVDTFDNIRRDEKSGKIQINDEGRYPGTNRPSERGTERKFDEDEHQGHRVSTSAGTTPRYRSGEERRMPESHHNHRYYANTPTYYRSQGVMRNQEHEEHVYTGSGSNYRPEGIRSQGRDDQRYFADSSSYRSEEARSEGSRQDSPYVNSGSIYRSEEERGQGSRQDTRYIATTMRYRNEEDRRTVQEFTRQSPQLHLVYAQSVKDAAESASSVQEDVDVVDCKGRQFGDKSRDAEGSASETRESKVLPNEKADVPNGSTSRNINSSSRLESQPGYIDIVYADKVNGTMKRFGNVNAGPGGDPRFYGIADLMKDIRESSRIFKHNFTSGQPLTKRNDAVKIALQGKEVNDSIRYAQSYQEKQGYFEEGMQLMYHYGKEPKLSASRQSADTSGKRTKRAHTEVAEDDVMHVILRVHVPFLSVKSQYMLSGKVGKEILRGNGQLNGNFTELIADFTVELKKVNDTLMIVRAARAKLTAKDKKITLQGMDEKGPVKSVLSHGLMAAEAVAAMLADDLATKALNEKTADAMIYRLYKNLPDN